VKKAGGMKISFAQPPKIIDEKMVYNILRDYKILNCEVLVRDEYGKFRIFHKYLTFLANYLATVDDLIDVIMKDHRTYIKW
jgi:ribosome-interacting GTPase 1